MAVGNAAMIVAAIVTVAFQATDRSSEVGRVLLAIAPIEVIALAIIVPRFEATGAVLTFDAAAVIAAAILGFRYARLARVAAPPVARWVTRFATAVAVGAVCAMAASALAHAGIAIAAGAVGYYTASFALRLTPDLRPLDIVRGWMRSGSRSVRTVPGGLTRRSALRREE